MKRRIGIYPGSFDPIHPGHIAFAKKAMRLCGLNEVTFLPEKKPRGKNGVTDMAHRIALIKFATKPAPGLRVVQLESERFTVPQTLPELRRTFKNSQFTLLIGSDIARTSLYRWEGLKVLLNEVSLAIGLRAPDSRKEMSEVMRRISRSRDVIIDYTIISAPEADMTSSKIRHGTDSLSRLYPGVLGYIQKHRLYGQA